MARLADLPTPALVLDLDVLEANLDRMASRMRRLGVALRPHVKTHKCVEIAGLQRQRGAAGITVATLEEAAAFADHGFDDITWAFPLIPSRLDEIVELARRVRLGVLLDSAEALEALLGLRVELGDLQSRGRPLRVWLKVDCGYHRAGVDPRSARAVALASSLDRAPTLEFAGILTHAGHAYECRGTEELVGVAEEERRVMAELATRLRAAGLSVAGVSVGSTPTMSTAESLEGVTEARPGNYAFHDYTQTVIGSCEVSDCALTVLTTVVSASPTAEHCVVDAGALALSKDAGPEPRFGEGDDEPDCRDSGACFGRVFRELGDPTLDSELRLVSLSQEHGEMRGRLPVGTKVRVLPNHSCLTAVCFDAYHVVRGDEVADRWSIHRDRR